MHALIFPFSKKKDSFTLYQIVKGEKMLVPFDRKGIAWWTDYNIKYRNPAFVNGSFANAFAGIFSL